MAFIGNYGIRSPLYTILQGNNRLPKPVFHILYSFAWGYITEGR